MEFCVIDFSRSFLKPNPLDRDDYVAPPLFPGDGSIVQMETIETALWTCERA